MPVRRFQNKVAVITGGAGGIGLAIAERLAALGCGLALVDIHADRLQIARQRLLTAGAKLSVHQCDVADSEQVSTVKEQILNQHGKTNILINSAGVSLAGPFANCNLDDLRWVMEVNFWGMIHCCKVFLPSMITEREAQVVNVCSSFGLLGFAGKAGYSASKFAVRGFSEALQMELAKTKVGMTIVYPGPVQTNLLIDGRAVSERQREKEMRFLASRAIPADLVAKKVVRGMRKNHCRVRISIDYAVIDWITRLSPSLAQALGSWVSRRMPF